MQLYDSYEIYFNIYVNVYITDDESIVPIKKVVKRDDPIIVIADVPEGPTEKWGSDAESVYDEDTESYHEEERNRNENDRQEFEQLGYECTEQPDDMYTEHAFQYPPVPVSYHDSQARNSLASFRDSNHMSPAVILHENHSLPPRPSATPTLLHNRTMPAVMFPAYHSVPSRPSATPTPLHNRALPAAELPDYRSHTSSSSSSSSNTRKQVNGTRSSSTRTSSQCEDQNLSSADMDDVFAPKTRNAKKVKR